MIFFPIKTLNQNGLMKRKCQNSQTILISASGRLWFESKINIWQVMAIFLAIFILPETNLFAQAIGENRQTEITLQSAFPTPSPNLTTGTHRSLIKT